ARPGPTRPVRVWAAAAPTTAAPKISTWTSKTTPRTSSRPGCTPKNGQRTSKTTSAKPPKRSKTHGSRPSLKKPRPECEHASQHPHRPPRPRPEPCLRLQPSTARFPKPRSPPLPQPGATPALVRGRGGNRSWPHYRPYPALSGTTAEGSKQP